MGLTKLNNQGDTILKDIFEDVITVYEDIQGSKMIVNFNGKDFEFRTKSINNDPISLIDVSLQKYYNKAFNFFYSLDERVLSLIPKNWYFCFEYFPDNQPAHIEYKKSPKNSLILTGIIKGSKKKFKYNIEEIIEFSNLFNCDPLPVVFHGKLNQKQKEGIKYFLHTSKEDLEYVFGDKNFSFFFYKLLDPTHKHSFLMEEGEFQPNTQRLIIKTNSNDHKYEVLNPLYERTVENIDTEFTEVYSLIILNFLNYIQNVDLSDLKLSGKKYDEVYMNLICKLYNMYMNDNSEELVEFEFSIPKFFNKDKFKINTKFISNNLTKKYVNKNDKFEYIFKSILGSFRQKKTKEIGLFNKNSLVLFNKFIDSLNDIIHDYLNKMKEDKLRNTNLMDFGRYYDFQYDTDADGKVYPDVYTEFEADSIDKKKKLKK